VEAKTIVELILAAVIEDEDLRIPQRYSQQAFGRRVGVC
jgi:hypothetical protein